MVMVIDGANSANEAIEGIEGNADTLHYVASVCNYGMHHYLHH